MATTVEEAKKQLELAEQAEQQRAAAAWQAEQEREQAARVRAAEPQIKAFHAEVDRALAITAPSKRPASDIRGLARVLLHSAMNTYMEDLTGMERLCQGDPRFAQLRALNVRAQRMISTGGAVGDETLEAELDELEVVTWRAVIERARWVAGEA